VRHNRVPGTSCCPGRVRALASGPIPGVILFVRQGDRSYTVTAGYADKARQVPMRASGIYPIGIRASGATTTWSPSGTMASRTRWVGHCSLGTRRTPRRVNRPIVRPCSSTGNAPWS
jgi:hypothetical protein